MQVLLLAVFYSALLIGYVCGLQIDGMEATIAGNEARLDEIERSLRCSDVSDIERYNIVHIYFMKNYIRVLNTSFVKKLN